MKLLSRKGVKDQIYKILFQDIFDDVEHDIVDEIMKIYDGQLHKLLYLERKKTYQSVIHHIGKDLNLDG